MATSKVRESATALAKDKKTVSSTNSHPTNTKRTTITAKPRSATSSTVDKASSTLSEKHGTKYIKPTRASQIEPPSLKSQSLSKKTGVHDATASSKPIVDRRRSFDKAPSATRLQKAIVSPGHRERTVTVRTSSSLSSKAIVDKTTKTVRDGKTQALSSRNKSNVKSSVPSSIPTFNKKARPVGSKVTKRAEHVTQISDYEAKSDLDHQETSSDKSEQVEGDHNEVEIPIDQGFQSDHSSSIVNEHEQHNNVDSDQSMNGGGEVERVIPTVSEELKPSIQVVDEDQEDGAHNPEAQAAEMESDNSVIVESSYENSYSVNASDEIKVGAIEEEGEESNIVQVIENLVRTLDDTEGTESESNIGSTQQEGRDNVEGRPEEKSETTASKNQGGSEGKKESPGYNDVIEETKNKLMEKRTNRVKALVGAFQTVINYESEAASK